MNIGYIGYALDRPLTGIGRYTVDLANALHKVHDTGNLHILSDSINEALDPAIFNYVHLPGTRTLPGILSVSSGYIPHIVRVKDLDVVHDPNCVSPFLFGVGGAKSVVTIHDVFPLSIPGNSTRAEILLYRYWLPKILPRVDAIITDSNQSRDDIVAYMGISLNKMFVISLGVSNRFVPQSRQEVERVRANHNLPERYLLYVGAVEKRKNLTGLLHACHKLWQTGELSYPLVVVGGSRWRSSDVAKTVSSLNIESKVQFTGYVADNELPAIYSGAEVFVFPSFYEGFGFPPLEAMACGTPVVCSNSSSLPEVVGDAAVMFDPNSVDEIARAITDVISNRELRDSMRHKGLERAKQFTWERTARETLRVYEHVCNA